MVVIRYSTTFEDLFVLSYYLDGIRHRKLRRQLAWMLSATMALVGTAILAAYHAGYHWLILVYTVFLVDFLRTYLPYQKHYRRRVKASVDGSGDSEIEVHADEQGLRFSERGVEVVAPWDRVTGFIVVDNRLLVGVGIGAYVIPRERIQGDSADYEQFLALLQS